MGQRLARSQPNEQSIRRKGQGGLSALLFLLKEQHCPAEM
jgi:hypothetical protein